MLYEILAGVADIAHGAAEHEFDVSKAYLGYVASQTR